MPDTTASQPYDLDRPGDWFIIRRAANDARPIRVVLNMRRIEEARRIWDTNKAIQAVH